MTYRMLTNEDIPVMTAEVILIDADGNKVGAVASSFALEAAKRQSLDLVMINPKSLPPVCKILDFAKYRREERAKVLEVRRAAGLPDNAPTARVGMVYRNALVETKDRLQMLWAAILRREMTEPEVLGEVASLIEKLEKAERL